jgi:molybdenum cofactor cytidylyltransferase
MSVAAIVLAAGASRRLGHPKQLVKVNGETLVKRTIRLAEEAGAAPVMVVLGAHRETICASVQFGDAIAIVNGNWEQGLATSIRAGMEAVDAASATIDGVLLMGCDQPRLTANHLRSLIEAFELNSTPTIVASAYAGVHGVPAVFPRNTFASLRSLGGDKGARVLLEESECPTIALPFEGGEVDIDFPEDIAQLK